MLKNFSEIQQYLESIGYELLPYQSKNQVDLGNRKHMVTIGPNHITVLRLFEDDFSRNWKQVFHLITDQLISLYQFITIIDSVGIIPMSEAIGYLADNSEMKEKRILFRIREAVKEAAV